MIELRCKRCGRVVLLPDEEAGCPEAAEREGLVVLMTTPYPLFVCVRCPVRKMPAPAPKEE